MNYVYRCIASQAVNRPALHNISASAASWSYETIAAQQNDGFEYVGAHEVMTWVPAGCLGFLTGSKGFNHRSTVLVFRRPA